MFAHVDGRWLTPASGTLAGITRCSAMALASAAGDDAPVPMMDRDAVRQMMAEPDPCRVLARYAAQVRAVAGRAAGVMVAAWAAAPGDPAVAALMADPDAQRLRGMTALAASIAAKARQAGCLADGITEEDIRDTLWAFNSPQLGILLLRDRGWSPDQYEAWLARSWTRLLLDPR
jgi:GNAT superfamily N-acetyltransferase